MFFWPPKPYKHHSFSLVLPRETVTVTMSKSTKGQTKHNATAATTGRGYNPSGRRFVFTSFSEVEPVYNPTTMRLLAYQREKCPDTGRLHWQGYIGSTKSVKGKSFGTEENGLLNAHFEPARGTEEQCLEYVSKEESRVEGFVPVVHGTKVTRGTTSEGSKKRKPQDDLRDALKSGKTDKEILEENATMWFKHHRDFGKARSLYVDPREDMTPCIVILGKTGLGKSSVVRSEDPDYYAKNNTEYWDNYDGRSPVLLDDFYGGVKHSDLLNWINLTKYQANQKFSTGPFNPKKFWITSNDCPSEWYGPAVSENRKQALYRRFSEIWVFTAFLEYEIFRSDERSTAWVKYLESEARMTFRRVEGNSVIISNTIF